MQGCTVEGPLADLIHRCSARSGLQPASTTRHSDTFAVSHRCSPCQIRPLSFFVSWQGVLTLAYRCEQLCCQTVLSQSLTSRAAAFQRRSPSSSRA